MLKLFPENTKGTSNFGVPFIFDAFGLRSVTQRGHHDGLDGVHTVLSLVEDDAVRALEHILSDFDAIQAELLVDVAAHLGLEVVVSRQAVHELAVRVAGHFHHLLVDLVRHEQVDALFPDLGGFAH